MRSHLQLVSSVAENPDPKQLGEPCVCVRQWSRDHDFQPWKVPKPMSGLSLLRHENISQHILRTYACMHTLYAHSACAEDLPVADLAAQAILEQATSHSRVQTIS